MVSVQLCSSTGLEFIKELSDTGSISSSDYDTAEEGEETDQPPPLQKENTTNNGLEDEEEEEINNRNKYGYPMTLNEVDYRDLPFNDDVIMTLPPTTFIAPVGIVRHTTEELTIIEALPGTLAIGEGTIFWSKERTFLGVLFETLGPVKAPFYSIRVGPAPVTPLSPGLEVYAALDDPELSTFIFMDNLLKEKGSDASWKNDHEVPLEFQDFSDDEHEESKKKRGSGRNKTIKSNYNGNTKTVWNKRDFNVNRQRNFVSNNNSVVSSLPFSNSSIPPLFPPPLLSTSSFPSSFPPSFTSRQTPSPFFRPSLLPPPPPPPLFPPSFFPPPQSSIPPASFPPSLFPPLPPPPSSSQWYH